MKVVLTGGTGFVGGEVLSQLLAHPAVERVTCLTRRPVAPAGTKAVDLLHDDFAAYGDAHLDRMAGHACCIWALGGKTSDIPDVAALERVTHRFTLALAQAVCDRGLLPFRFCYLSGMGADPTETAWLPWERDTRHLKGRTERDLHALADRFPGFAVTCFRPGGILSKGSSRWVGRVLAPVVVRVEELAAALVRAAVESPDGPGTLTNGQIKAFARRG